jgi:hypothetical protein
MSFLSVFDVYYHIPLFEALPFWIIRYDEILFCDSFFLYCVDEGLIYGSSISRSTLVLRMLL